MASRTIGEIKKCRKDGKALDTCLSFLVHRIFFLLHWNPVSVAKKKQKQPLTYGTLREFSMDKQKIAALVSLTDIRRYCLIQPDRIVSDLPYEITSSRDRQPI